MKRQRGPTCPNCQSTDVVTIVYGMPGIDLMEAEKRGEVALGGCVVSEGHPTHQCQGCRARFAGTKRRKIWSRSNLRFAARPKLGDLVVLVDGGGVLVDGTRAGVDVLIDKLTSVEVARSRRIAGDVSGMAASATALVKTHQEYVNLSPASLQLLREYGAVPGTAGFFRMFVRGGRIEYTPSPPDDLVARRLLSETADKKKRSLASNKGVRAGVSFLSPARRSATLSFASSEGGVVEDHPALLVLCLQAHAAA